MNTNKIIKQFLDEWRNKDEYLGCLLSGSWATNTVTSHSDIDLLIILEDSFDHKERGNKIVDGTILEYIAYPKNYWQKLFDEEVKKNQRLWLRMWRIGKIVEDKKDTIEKLKNEAIKAFDSLIIKLNGSDLEMAKYLLWDGLENLKDLKEKNQISFKPTYFLQLSKVVGNYAHYLGITLPAVAKWDKYFQDKNYRKVYKFDEIKDKFFTKMVLEAMSRPDMKKIDDLTNHVLEKLGGFEIDNWKLNELVY